MERKLTPSVKVFARQRPLLESELDEKVFSTSTKRGELCVKTGRYEKFYHLDLSFERQSSQEEIFMCTVAPYISSIVRGYGYTLIAYGAGGTGKTHTLLGDIHQQDELNERPKASAGMVIRAAHQIFYDLNKLDVHTEYTVRISVIEVYNEDVLDLLNNRNHLRICDDPYLKGAVHFKGITKITVVSVKDVYRVLNSYKQTSMLRPLNSRATTIFTIYVDTSENNQLSEIIVRSGKLQFVDLASSEHLGNQNITEIKIREVSTMSRSLVTFLKVIKAVGQKMQYIPFRDSKLTRILQDNFGGTSRTAILITYVSLLSAWDDLISALDVITIARNIVNAPTPYLTRENALVHELAMEVIRLKGELAAARSGVGFFITQGSFNQLTGQIEDTNSNIIRLTKEISDREEQSQCMENEMRRLKESFEYTRRELKRIRDQLEATRAQHLNDAVKIDMLKGEYKQAREEAGALLNVCDNVIKGEEILYKKYQERASNNRANINVAQHTSCVANKTFAETCDTATGAIPKRYENVHQGAEEARSSVTDAVSYGLPPMPLHEHIDARSIQRDREVYKMIDDLVENRRRRHNFIKTCLLKQENIGGGVESILGSAETYFDNIQLQIRVKSTARHDYFQRAFSLFGGLNHKFKTKIGDIVALNEFTKSMTAAIKNEVENFTSQKGDTNAEHIVMSPTVDEIMAHSRKLGMNISLQLTGETVSNLVAQANQQLTTQQILIKENVTSMRHLDQYLCNLSEEEKGVIKQHVDLLSDVCDKEIRAHEQSVLEDLQLFNNYLSDHTDNSVNTGVSSCGVMGRISKTQIEGEARRHQSVLRNLQTARAVLYELQNKVGTNGHAGDTPVRRQPHPFGQRSQILRPIVRTMRNGPIIFDSTDESDDTPEASSSDTDK